MRNGMILLLTSFLLAGCGATATVNSAPVANLKSESSEADPSGGRHLLAAGSQTLFGASYRVTRTYGQKAIWGKWFNGKWWYDTITGYAKLNEYVPDAQFSSNSDLIKASYDRYVYQVPEGQVLVLNQIQGLGKIYVNGFQLTASDDSRTIQYLIGGGELVTFRFDPTTGLKKTRTTGGKGDGTDINVDVSYTVSISGFTVNPEALNGRGAVVGK